MRYLCLLVGDPDVDGPGPVPAPPEFMQMLSDYQSATQIAVLYAALASHEPTPVVQANRAVAVAMAEGPAAGLAILDGLGPDGPGAGWHLLYACRADLLRRLGRTAEAAGAYRAALALIRPRPNASSSPAACPTPANERSPPGGRASPGGCAAAPHGWEYG